MPAPDSDLDLLSKAARAAGAVALKHFERDPQVWTKPGDAGPVTEADLEIDAMLGEMLQAARPDYGWLSEETEDGSTRLRSETVFIVDPIDGTRAFIEGGRDWSHSLAIAHRGEVVAAAVYHTRRDALYTAARGAGAAKNGRPIRVSDRRETREATALGAKPNFHPDKWKRDHGLTRQYRSSLAYRLCLVAEGRFDAMLSLRPTWEWDIAAGALILSEAGGAASDRNGGPLRFNNPMPQTNGIVAANPAIHAAILEDLHPAEALPG